MKPFWLAALLCLVACHQSRPPPPLPPPVGARTIADPLAYLVEGKTPGDVAHKLGLGDRMTYRRRDFGDYQEEDAYLLPDGSAVLDWSYPPFGPFAAENGDGGERYVVNGDEVDIVATQDGSKRFVQHFNGWIAFRSDANATPICFVAPIRAYTCYWRQTVTYPNICAVDTIIGDHYSTRSPTSARAALERSFWGRGYGRLVWQAWRFRGNPVDPERCPDFGFNAPPQQGMILLDCRENVNVVEQTAPLTPGQLWQP